MNVAMPNFFNATGRSNTLLLALAMLCITTSTFLVIESWLIGFSLYLGWSLVALAFIDARHGVLPDAMNLPLIPMGLLAIGLLSPAQVPTHVIGAASGFLALTSVALIYRRLSGKDGLGGGDVKLFAAAGAWLGWPALPGVLLSASLLALLVALARSVLGYQLTAKDKIAFGPYLALALWCGWLFGPLTSLS